MAKNRLSVRPRFWLYMIAAILIVSALFGNAQKATMARQDETIVALREHVSVLQTESQRVARLLEFSKSANYAERVARDEFNMIKPGETLYVDINQ